MGPKQLTAALTTLLGNGEPVLIKGAPGVGKSDIVAQVADNLGYELLVSHPVVSDPTDYKGLPANVDGYAEFLPFGDLRAMLEADEPTIVFLDDLGQAPAVVQAACMQLLLARRVNGHCISDQVVFVAATNRRQDRAGVTGILEPVKSRFTTIVELEPNEEDWCAWALQNDMPTELIGFVHFRPALLNTLEMTSDIINHPCPRTLSAAGRLIKLGLTGIELLGGAVGVGCATEIREFLNTYQQLPNIMKLIANPDKAPIPEEPSAMYATIAALVEKLNKKNGPAIVRYANRLSGEYSMLLMKDGLRKHAELQHTKEFNEWAIRNADFFG